MTPDQIARFCALDDAGDALMSQAFDRMGLSARSHDRILRVARTIADLDGAEAIAPDHLAEAIQYRNTDILKGITKKRTVKTVPFFLILPLPRKPPFHPNRPAPKAFRCR